MPTPYFEVAHLTKHFSTDASTVAAIQDVSFSLQKGQFLSILGPSGCGKSTLFNLIAGLMQPDCGDIRLQGESMLLRPRSDRLHAAKRSAPAVADDCG